MKTVAIFSNGGFPIPAVNGGSVATHIEYLLNYNEKHPTMKFIVISMYNEQAKEKSKDYRYTKFIFINKKGIRFRVINGIRHELDKIHRLFSDEIYERGFIVESVRLLKKYNDKIDYILIKDKLNAAKYIRKHFQGIKIFSCAEINYLNNTLFENKPGQVKAIFENTDTIITVSDYIKKEITSIPMYNDYKCKVITCYNGLILNRFIEDISDDEKQIIRQKLGLSSNDFVIIFTGRLIKDKGLLELIKAFLSINNDAKLLIIGSNDFLKSQTTKYIEELYLLTQNNKNILFTGYINYSEIHKYYKIANLAIFPSMCEDAFNLSLLEAMASRIPVIITNSGGMVELATEKGSKIINRDENLISNMTKAIDEVIDNYGMTDNMVKISFEKSKLFTNEIYAKNMLNILSE